MKSETFKERMRAGEYFHALRLVPGAWTVLGIDGRSFTKFTAERFEKPFDERLRDLMVEAARALVEEMGAIYAYTESDEISLLFTPEWDLFDRELEKIVSVSAGIASSAFTLAAGELAHFDSRAWVGVSEADVVDYFRWRQADATRCALNGWCYWTLRRSGESVGHATSLLEGKGPDFKNELLFQHGINFNEVPLWQRRGVGLYREEYLKDGYNPITGQTVVVTRRRVAVDFDLAMKDDYVAFLRKLIAEQRTGAGSGGSHPAPPEDDPV